MTDTYAAATAMVADLKAKRVSARELLDAHVARNQAVGGPLNAVIATDIARAERDAQAIDDARARDETLGPLAGIPMTVKDGFDVNGLPATSGNPAFADRAPDCADAELVARTRGAGAVIWGKTNVPFMLSDFQSYNAIYGTTNNPYDVTRTPAGSSGGAAAALAAGITPLEIGSDIGGSLRHPANYCGVYSLKPTWGVLPMKGHVPPPPGIEGADADLGVGGPMARNVGDLKLLWDVLNKRAYTPPEPTKAARIALWDEEEGWPLDNAVKARVEAMAKALEGIGYKVERAKPKLDAQQLVDAYLDILIPIISFGFPQALREMMAASREADLAAVRDGRDQTGEARFRLRVTQSDGEIAAALRLRQTHKDALKTFFADGWDAILMPVTTIPPFQHDHSDPMNARTITVNGKTELYVSMLQWISLATSLHAPALAMPAGQTPEGLPVGVQLVGPERGDDTLFGLAAAAESEMGFVPPPL